MCSLSGPTYVSDSIYERIKEWQYRRFLNILPCRVLVSYFWLSRSSMFRTVLCTDQLYLAIYVRLRSMKSLTPFKRSKTIWTIFILSQKVDYSLISRLIAPRCPNHMLQIRHMYMRVLLINNKIVSNKSMAPPDHWHQIIHTSYLGVQIAKVSPLQPPSLICRLLLRFLRRQWIF